MQHRTVCMEHIRQQLTFFKIMWLVVIKKLLSLFQYTKSGFKHTGQAIFLYMPNSPRPLLGWDLLEQLKAEIRFEKGKVELRVENDQLRKILSLALTNIPVALGIPEEVQNQVYLGVWASETPLWQTPILCFEGRSTSQ